MACQEGAKLMLLAEPRRPAGDTYHTGQPARRCGENMSGRGSLLDEAADTTVLVFEVLRRRGSYHLCSAAVSLTSVYDQRENKPFFLTL